MAKLALIYGMRLLPSDELDSVDEAPITLKSGRKASVTMHLIEGSSEEEIKKHAPKIVRVNEKNRIVETVDKR